MSLGKMWTAACLVRGGEGHEGQQVFLRGFEQLGDLRRDGGQAVDDLTDAFGA